MRRRCSIRGLGAIQIFLSVNIIRISQSRMCRVQPWFRDFQITGFSCNYSIEITIYPNKGKVHSRNLLFRDSAELFVRRVVGKNVDRIPGSLSICTEALGMLITSWNTVRVELDTVRLVMDTNFRNSDPKELLKNGAEIKLDIITAKEHYT